MIKKNLLAWLMIVGSLSSAWSQISTGGNYPALQSEMFSRLRLERYVTLDQQSHEADFEWTFTKDEFLIRKGKGAIPVDLMAKLLSEGQIAEEIRGRWSLANGGSELVLTEIKSGTTLGKKKVSLTVERTGTGVVRVGEPEYVFGAEANSN